MTLDIAEREYLDGSKDYLVSWFKGYEDNKMLNENREVLAEHLPDIEAARKFCTDFIKENEAKIIIKTTKIETITTISRNSLTQEAKKL